LQFDSHPWEFSPRILGMPHPSCDWFSIPWKFFCEILSSYRFAKGFYLESFLIIR
jgi:hypothetical protein